MSSPSAAPLAPRPTEATRAEFRQWAEEVRAAATDRPLGTGPVRPSAPGGRTATERLPLGTPLRTAVGRTAREHATTPLTVGLAALAVTLARRTGAERVVAEALRVPVVVAVRDDLSTAELLAGTDLALERSLSLCVNATAGEQPPGSRLEFRHGKPPATLPGEAVVTLTDGEGGTAELTAVYDSERHTAAEIATLLGQLRTVLDALTAGRATTVGELPLLDPAERQRLLALGRGAALQAGAGGRPVHLTVADLASADPGRTAVVCGDDTVDRGTLDTWARRIAARLTAAGVRPGDRVGVLADRSTAMVAAVLGAMHAGAAYVPVDPANPDERIATLLSDAQAAAVIVTGAHGTRLAPFAGTAVVVADDPELRTAAPGDAADARPDAATGLDDAAYLIYTSGSTGAPKGVVVEHAQLAASTAARREVYPGEPVFLLLSPLAFDSSVAGLWGTLTAGGRLVVAGADEYRDPEALVGLIERHSVSHLLCVPSLYDTLLASAERTGPARLASLTTVITAGEALPEALLRRHTAVLGPSAALVNEYGPTECTVWASYRRCRPEGPVDIGGPVPGALLYVLDGAGRLVPPGVTGELHIGGAGVARGYLGRSEDTARAFVPDPFEGGAARMYRTGDLVRWTVEGTLEFLGRRDNQVKIRGHRIELGAVETALRGCPGVREAVVVPDAAGTRLAGFVLTDEPAGLPAVRARLAAKLPEAAVPSVLRALEVFPVTVNGKADRSALAALLDTEPAPAPAPTASVPAGDTLAQVAAAWAEVLTVDTVPADVNFFDLGGHSLLVIRLQDALERHT
ncbi:MAG: amino acid adenylation domain-containing protein, partial [Streptomyces sp.]|nr:amino acid adenylation domain-containing protein [Streptomyces sp.]